MEEKEKELIYKIGADKLRNIGEEIAEIIRKYGLQNSPDICEKLLRYILEVVCGWNCIDGHSNSQ